jgi:hypothetical protein
MVGGENPTSREFKPESPMFQGSPLDSDPRGGEAMVVGEQDIAIDVNPAVPLGDKERFTDLHGEFSSVFEGGMTEHRYYSRADYSTFYFFPWQPKRSNPGHRAQDPSNSGYQAPASGSNGGHCSFATPAQADGGGPEPLPSLHTELGGTYMDGG